MGTKSTAYYRMNEVMEMTGFSRATIYRHMAEGHMPEAGRAGPKIRVWPKRVIDEWLKGLEPSEK